MFDPNKLPFNKQIIIDLDEPRWALQVVNKLKILMTKTSYPEVKKILEHWTATFKTKSIPEIINILKQESEKSDSVLNIGYSYLAPFDSSSYHKIMVIINEGEKILSDRSFALGRTLSRKWDSRHPDNPCIYLFEEDLLVENSNHQSIGPLSDNLRIYIISHGSTNSNNLKGGQFHFKDIAKGIERLIGKHQQAVVNLISCYAGQDPTPNLAEDKGYDSFAAKLHAELFSMMKRDIPVVARNLPIGLRPGKKVTGKGFFISQRQQPGTKVIFTVDSQGNQVRLDAYYFRLKNKITRELQNLCFLKDINPARKTLLRDWKIAVETKTPEQILELMTTELNKPDSILNEEGWPYYLSVTDIATTAKTLIETTTVRALIKESEKVIHSPSTIKKPVLTGRIFFNSPEDSKTQKNTSEETKDIVINIKNKN